MYAYYNCFQFRTIMEPHLPHDYMKTDIYLIRWLKGDKSTFTFELFITCKI